MSLRKTINFAVFFVAMMLASCEYAHAQAVPGCPDGFVCITPAAARAALEAGDKAKALQTENTALKQAIEDLKKENTDWRVKYVEVFGRYDEIKQQRVEWMAERELMLKLIRPKKFGIINF